MCEVNWQWWDDMWAENVHLSVSLSFKFLVREVINPEQVGWFNYDIWVEIKTLWPVIWGWLVSTHSLNGSLYRRLF